MQRAWNSIVRHYYGDSDPPEELVRQVEVIPASLEGNIAGRHVRNARTAVTEIIPTSDRRNVQFELEQTSMERLQRLNQQADTSPEEEQAARVLSTIQTGSFLHLQSHSIPIAMSNTCPSRISSSWTYHRNESDLHDRRSDLSSVTSDRPVLPQHEFYQTDEAPHIEMNKHADGLTSTEGTQTQTTMTRNGQPVLPPYGSGDAWAADGVEGRTTAASFLTNEVLNLQYRSPGFWDGTDQVPTTASNYLPVTIPVCGEVDAWASCENEGSQSGHFNPQSWTQQTASFAAYGTSDAWATQPLASFWSSS
ncbi:unnamed protein product [Aspergillus oryzae]|nr:unnamed protein product [Aspergillus oryzae]